MAREWGRNAAFLPSIFRKESARGGQSIQVTLCEPLFCVSI